jgi:hypothetical protein
MIKIVVSPTYSARKYFNFVDFQTLSEVITIVYNAKLNKQHVKRQTITLKLHLSKKINCYKWGTNSIYLYERDYKNPLSSFFARFLHEFRHWYQCKIMKVSFDENYDSTGMAYYRCPIEKDARYFGDNISGACLQIYKKIVMTKKLLNDQKDVDHGFR